MEHPINFMYGMHGRAAGGDGAPVSADDAQHPRRALQGRPVAGGGGAGHGREGLAPVLGHHAAAHHARLHLRRAAGLHLDLRRLHHAAGARRAGPARPAGLSQHRAVRRPAHFPHGHRDLGAAGRARHRVRARRAPVRGDQGLQLARLLEGRAPPAGAGASAGWRSAFWRCCCSSAFIPQVGVLLAAVGRGWALTPFPVALHAGVLPAGEHRDAEVHHQLVPVLAGSPSCLCLVDRRADGVDHGAHAGARAQHDGRAHHADPRHSRAPRSASPTSAPSTFRCRSSIFR